MKSDSLYFRVGMSAESIEKMKVIRKAFIKLSDDVEALGSSRETALAFTHIESALAAAIKHICLTDPQAEKEII
jgi:hypothetical protein